ncbi:MAG: GIY-YIG nuclease family protein, partial [Veillonella sp.]|nr:GIY-YIG nuclease family protein [Veillonella sp.]
MDTNTFIVKRDASEYEITEVNFAASMLNNLMGRRFENWPVLYLLTNSDKKKPKAYIGHTTSAQRRMRQHLASKKKDIFEDAHIIYSEEFNQSVTFDYESRLIELFSAEGTYELTNGNGGLSNKDYFDRERYLKLFDRL